MARMVHQNLFFCLGILLMKRILYQFPLSHYCEKARWLLDFKDLEYSAKNLFPAAHRVLTLFKSQSSTVPLVKDGKEWIGDSTELAFYLDAKYTLRPLLPSDPVLRSKAVTIEDLADKAGAHVRRWIYSQILAEDEVMNVMLDYYSYAKPFKKQLAPIIRKGISQLYNVTPQKGAASLVKIQQAIDELEIMLLANGGRYFVGDCLGLADITVASMFAPMLSIKATPWQTLTPSNVNMQAFYGQFINRPLGQWIVRIYQEERHARANWRGD
jgi:glutathione S-transferase